MKTLINVLFNNNKISLWNNSIVKCSLLQQVIWNLIKSCLLLRHFGSISVRINLSIWISVGYKNQVCKFSFTDEGDCMGLRNSQAGPKMRIDSAVNKGTKLENSRSMLSLSANSFTQNLLRWTVSIMPSSSNAEQFLVLSLLPKRKAKKVSCRQKPNIGLQLVSLS